MTNKLTKKGQTVSDARIIKLNEEAWQINRQLPKQSIVMSSKAVALATSSGDHLQKAVGQFILGTAQIWISEYESALQNIHEAKHYFEQNKIYQRVAQCHYSLGSCYYYLADYEESLKCFFDSLNIYTKTENIIGQADAYNGIGSVYNELENYQEAVKTLERSSALLENNTAGEIRAKVVEGLGEVTLKLKDFERSHTYFKESIELSEIHGLNQPYILSYEGLAKIDYINNKIESAIAHIDKAIAKAREVEFKIGLARGLFLKGKLFLGAEDEKEAFKYFNEAINIVEEIDSTEMRAKFHQTMYEYYENKENYELTVYHLKKHHLFQAKLDKQRHGLHLKSLQIKINLERLEKQNEIYKSKNKDLRYKTKYLKESNDRIQTISKLGQIIASKLELEELLNEIYEQINKLMIADVLYIGLYNKSEQCIDFPFYIKENERVHNVKVSMNHTGKFTVWCIKNKKELVINNFKTEASEYITLTSSQQKEKMPASVLIVPVTIKSKMIGVIGVHSYTKDSFTPDKVDILKTLGAYVSIALENAKVYKSINDLYGLIENKNKEIVDSINYSKRLQDAILPGPDVIKEWLPKSFVIYKPKAVVSGDFYWVEHLNDYTYFAAADCTGHGVPGALVSVVCSNALNRAVNEFKIIEPAEILNKTRELVIETFAKSGEDVKDGMDIALCAIKDQKVVFSGSNNPLWIVRQNDLITEKQKQKKSTVIGDYCSLIEFKANKQPIGLHVGMTDFTQENIQLYPGDRLYIFTDGFADQFGGKRNKKFKYKPFKQFLIDLHQQDFNTHKDLINDAFERWKGELEQVDDICIIGIKI